MNASLLRVTLTLTFGLVVSGCYSYAPVAVEQIPVGTPVRARVSAAEAARLEEALGRDSRVLQGKWLGVEADRVALSVPATGQSPGMPVRLEQHVAIERPSLMEVELRRFDAWKTAGIAAVGVAAATWIIATQFGEDLPDGEGNDKGGSDAVLIPLFRWLR